MGLSAIGWVNSLYTLWHRQQLQIEGMTKSSFCNVGGTLNCDAVALSRFSALYGIPTAAFGMLYYSILFILSIWGILQIVDNKDENRAPAASVIFWSTLFGLIPTIAMAYISTVELKVLCLMCLLTYLINIVLVLVTFKLQSKSQSQPRDLLKAVKILPISLYVTLAVAAVLHLFLPSVIENSLSGGNKLDRDNLGLYVQAHFAQPVKNLQTIERPSYGPTDAKLTLVEFSDFQCTFCAREALTTPQILKQYEGKIRVVFKNYPLDPSCNASVKNAVHQFACAAAKTGYCVYKIKGDEAFFTYKNEIFTRQSEMSQSMIKETAKKSALGDEELDKCVNDYATHQAIAEDINEGTAAGVEGTPTAYINGKKLDGVAIPIIFQAVLSEYFKLPLSN